MQFNEEISSLLLSLIPKPPVIFLTFWDRPWVVLSRILARMKPRTSPRSVQKTTPDKLSGAAPHVAIPAWAENKLTRVVMGSRARSAEVPSTADLHGAVVRTGFKETELNGGILDQSSVRRSKSVPIAGKRQPQSLCPEGALISDKTSQPAFEPLLAVSETAQLLGVSQKTVRRLIDRGDLAAVCIGRSVRIRPDVLAAYIDRRVP